MIIELLINHIIDKYNEDMGRYFDEYKGQEEYCYEQTYDLFTKSSLKDKIKLLMGKY